jgi:A/G-specific adenine glycosylase
MTPPWRSALLEWYDRHRRDLPWRTDPTPYRVLVSEVMLQQTQVATVLPYFQRWMQRFPDFAALAAAGENEVLNAWQGLGYYRRARALRQAAIHVAEDGLPSSVGAWAELPGIGPYTAAAVASIAQGEPAALVDGNVERVFARLLDNEASGAALTKQAWLWAEQVLERNRPGDHNQALMELGATVCRPANPDCPACPVSAFCMAYARGTVAQRPVPAPKPNIIERQDSIVIPWHANQVGLVTTPAGEWWEGLQGFPRFAGSEGRGEPIGRFTHHVTRFRLRVTVEVSRSGEWDVEWVPFAEVDRRALPSPQRRAWQLFMRHRQEATLEFEAPPLPPEFPRSR